MRVKLVPIGNSRGIRIPKAVIERYRLGEDVELDIRPDALVIRPVRAARQGWEQAFKRMRRRGDDELLDVDAERPSRWDRKEWTW